MALHFDVSKVADHANLTTWVVSADDKRWHPVTECLVFSLMAVEMNGLRHEEDVQEFLFRYFYMKAAGDKNIQCCAPGEKELRDLTAAEVRAHIGIRTNVSTETRRKFTTGKMLRWITDDANRYLRAANEAAAGLLQGVYGPDDTLPATE